MSKHFKTEGIILRKVDFNEADRIITILTPELGKIDCIAKGARRLKSKFLGRLELFYEVSFTCFEGRSLNIVNEARVLSALSEQRDPKKHQALFYLGEITHKLIQDAQHIEGVYSLLQQTLTELSKTEKPDVLLHAFITKLLSLTGFLSPWNQCATCSKSLNPDHSIYLCQTDLNVVCEPCHQAADQLIETPLLKWINFMQRGALSDILKVSVEPHDQKATWNWLSTVLSTVFSKPLKSEAFLHSA